AVDGTGVGRDDRFGDFAGRAVAEGDGLDRPAALGVRLEAEHAIEPGAVHSAALDEDVSRAARDLAADDDAAVAVLHLAVAHDDVLDRRVDAAAVGVSSRLERDAVVAGVEAAALD